MRAFRFQLQYSEIKCSIDPLTALRQSGAALIFFCESRLLQNRLNIVLFMKL